MYKKINVFLIGFFSILTIYTNIGYMLYIPLLFYYLIRDIKNIYLFTISGTISLLLSFLLTNSEYPIMLKTHLVPFLLLMIIMLFVLWMMSKINKSFMIYIFVILLDITMQFLFLKGITNYLTFFIFLGISLLLYIFLEKNLIDSISPNNHFYNSAYVNILISIITIVGAAEFKVLGINLGLIVGIYFSMYFGLSLKNIYAMLYNLITTFILILLYQEFDALLIIIIGAFYLLKFTYPIILTTAFSTGLIFIQTNFNQNFLISIMIVSIIFEILKIFLIKEKLTDEESLNKLYSKITMNVSNEVLGFAGFLDKFINNFKDTNEYNKLIHDSIQTIMNNCCSKCPNQKDCKNYYRANLYYYFKHILENNELQNEEYLYFKKNCIKFNDLKELALTLNRRFNFNEIQAHNSTLIVQLMGVSNSLRKYAIEIVSRKELDAKLIFDLKKDIGNFGYDLVYLEVIKPFEDDFEIELGLNETNNKDLIQNIKKLASNILTKEVSVLYQKNDGDINYYKVIPVVRINIQYGYGSLSANEHNICGDNYLIKEMCNGKFVTAISDGMGKGFLAFKESNETLNLVSQVLEQNLDVSTSIEILNTFYAVQEYLDRYSTLDLLEINRHTKLAKFYKMGASTSYIIKQNGTINKIYNQNLPFGIDDYIDYKDYFLEDGDLILMSSDGIFENIKETDILDEYIKKIRGETPQKIVYDLLQYTMNNKIQIKDDATLIALKIKTV